VENNARYDEQVAQHFEDISAEVWLESHAGQAAFWERTKLDIAPPSSQTGRELWHCFEVTRSESHGTSLGGSMLWFTEQELIKHILDCFHGWRVHRSCVDGLEVTDCLKGRSEM
jgi:hypothetical protein